MKNQLNPETQAVLKAVNNHVGWFDLQQILAQEIIMLADTHKKDSATFDELHDTIGELKFKIEGLESDLARLRKWIKKARHADPDIDLRVLKITLEKPQEEANGTN